MKIRKIYLTAVTAILAVCAGTAAQATFIDTVLVGNSGNAADTRPTSAGYGAVEKSFFMGKNEITAGQYAEFLNAVAKTDNYGLYNTYMANTATNFGCNIQRTVSSEGYSYSVDPDWANRPVNYVSWGDAARFANWLQNGQQNNPATTEDGAYALNGKIYVADLMTITRKSDALYVIPTENEWYKAAYYDPNQGGLGVGGYWTYPTKNDLPPSNSLDASGTNNANYYTDNYTIGSPKYRTQAGEFVSSPSAYGTFDQGGNIYELTETAATTGSFYVKRGGAYDSPSDELSASLRNFISPVGEFYNIGFRMAIVPEPTSLVMLLGIGAMGLLYWQRHI